MVSTAGCRVEEGGRRTREGRRQEAAVQPDRRGGTSFAPRPVRAAVAFGEHSHRANIQNPYCAPATAMDGRWSMASGRLMGDER